MLPQRWRSAVLDAFASNFQHRLHILHQPRMSSQRRPADHRERHAFALVPRQERATVRTSAVRRCVLYEQCQCKRLQGIQRATDPRPHKDSAHPERHTERRCWRVIATAVRHLRPRRANFLVKRLFARRHRSHRKGSERSRALSLHSTCSSPNAVAKKSQLHRLRARQWACCAQACVK